MLNEGLTPYVFELHYDNDKDERAKVNDASWTLSINKKSSGNFSYRFLT